MKSPQLAIIGSGLTGLTLAEELQKKADITLFDKSRGVGGRLSTRYAENYQFDHGAQAIQASHPEFVAFMKYLEAGGIVAEWGDGYVAVPKMNAIGKHLAKDFNIKLGTHISKVERAGEQWQLVDLEGNFAGLFDAVICTAPPEQNCVIMPDSFPHKTKILKRKLRGCYALMLGFAKAPNLTLPEAGNDIIASIVKNHEKPERKTDYSLMVLSQYDWAEARMEDDQNTIKAQLIDAVSALSNYDVSVADHQALHRWRYANVATTGTQPSFIAPELGLAACGDWCLNGDAESAYISALHTAQAMKSLF